MVHHVLTKRFVKKVTNIYRKNLVTVLMLPLSDIFLKRITHKCLLQLNDK